MSQQSVRYELDGIRKTFPIPFPYGSHSDFACAKVDSDGEETRLTEGEDYHLVEHCLILDEPEEHDGRLHIFLVEPLARALEGNIARCEAAEAAGISEAHAAWHAEAAARIAREAAETADSAARKAFGEIVERAQLETASATNTLEAIRDQAVSLAKEAAQQAVSQIYQVCREAVERAHNPGIAALNAFERIYGYSQGFFVVNRNLVNSTASMGFWGARALSAIAWDGFFAIIPNCPGHAGSGWKPDEIVWPDDPLWNPGKPGSSTTKPGASQPGGSTVPGSRWLPCDHTHY